MHLTIVCNFFSAPVAAQSTDGECSCDGISNPKVVLGLLVWAILLTIILIILIYVGARSVHKEYENDYDSAYNYAATAVTASAR